MRVWEDVSDRAVCLSSDGPSISTKNINAKAAFRRWEGMASISAAMLKSTYKVALQCAFSQSQWCRNNLTRNFGSGKKQKNLSPRKRHRGGRPNPQAKSAGKGNKTSNKRLSPPTAPRVKEPKQKSTFIPPVLLAPTGSPYTFVARSALEDPAEGQSLFSNYQTLPRTYEVNEFAYVPPRTFNFEYPKQGKVEVAFLGRSNVGKSSLVNSLMRKDLCKTSKTPGRTQIPFYYGLFPRSAFAKNTGASDGPGLESAQGYLVDLPGYGYGSAPVEVVEDWQAKTQEWLIDRRESGALRRLFVLLDARRDAPSSLDNTVLQWAQEAEIPFSVVLTKADRVSLPLVVKQVNDLCMRYSSQDALVEDGTYQSPVVHVTSAQKKWGINELLESIEAEFLGE